MNTRKRWLGWTLAVCQLVTPATAQNPLPALGDDLEMSLAAERQLGDRIARELYRRPDILDDPVLGDYLHQIWQRLARSARQRGELAPEMQERYAWKLFLRRDASVNAFALPGGYLGVHLGLIAAVNSTDELAAVLGHELSHVTQRHLARAMGRQNGQTPWLLGAMILAVLAGARSPDGAAAVLVGGQAAAAQGQLNFSRDMEREADRVGYAVMTEAGFSGQGAVDMFTLMQQANRYNDTGAFPYLRTHPLTTERMADMQARQQQHDVTGKATPSDVHRMMAARARFLVNASQTDIQKALMNAQAAADGVLERGQSVGALYAGVLGAQRQREFGTAWGLHRRLAQQVLGDKAAQEQVHLLAGELAVAQGERTGVQAWLQQDGRPAGRTGRAQQMIRAQAQIKIGQAKLAAEQLREWLVEQPSDAQVWLLLSQAYAELGMMVQSVRAQAEYQAAQFEYEAALDRLRAARELLASSKASEHIEASIIDARSRELATLLREQMLER